MSIETRGGPPLGRLLEQTTAFAVRTLQTLRRNSAVAFWAVAFPAMFYLLSVSLFIDTGGMPAEVVSAVKATHAVSYGAFAALTVFLNTFSQSLVADVERGRYRQFRALPVSPTADFLGRFAAAYLFAVAAVLAVLGVGAVTGAAFTLRSAASIPVALLGLLALGLFAASIAVVLVAVVPDAKFASIVAVSVVMLAFFLTGYNGIQPGMLAGAADFVNVVPNALATRLAVHHLVAAGGWTQAGLAPPGAPTSMGHVALLAGYAVAGLALAVAATRRSLYGGAVR
ncbi:MULTISPECIES: ABC transporter permease [Halobacterium]|uniref:ABC transporter permease n=1 Tax=Halobacterium TaxID=2239 RepID=UPI0019639A45|nr:MULTISPECIES: ABC transporter permease [Halobacterium]MDL0122501.1 ABC transporter permease [Halobacterium salinarum]MDL0128655.1 ABC transporter permease [Halobacterium salinarum]MDL0132739.1 ABC transporter permease [Halobacterium salinarum]QRY25147.1 ABC transporter permease [Halobacterium sp. BOL4-2]